MAEVLVGQFLSTEEVYSEEKVTEMNSRIKKLDPDSTQYATMTNKVSSRAATREKVNWLEETLVTNVFTVDAAYTSGAATISIGTVESNAVKVNDTLRNMRTGEAFLVKAVGANGDLTVYPSLGDMPSAAGQVGDKLLFTGSAFPQGSTLPEMKYAQRTLGYNFTQIFRTVWNFSMTATSIEYYGGREPAKEAARKTVEHKREIENKGARTKDVKAPKLTKAMMRPAGAKDTGNVVRGIKVSNPDRVIDEASGATKLDLVRYYDRIADHILPHLVARPIALVRAPYGVKGELFFQKHGDTVKVPGIKQLDRKYWPEHDPMLEIDTREALVAAAQMNMVELHTWNSTTRAIAKPDRMLFDLDPGEGITWDQLVEATELTKRMLDMLELESFLKTSGGKGLHIVVPLAPKDDYDTVKNFSQAVVVHLSRTLPKLFVAKSGAQNRIGRIFIDYLRNGKGATTAAAFSARARPGLGVSVPLEWSELRALESAAQWNIFSVHERLAKLRADPWKDYAKTRQAIGAATRRLRAAAT